MRGASIHRHTARFALAALASLTLASAAWASGPSGGTGPSGSSGSPSHQPAAGALGKTGMWIWYVARSQGGNLNSIIATAHRHAVGTVIIKSGDGSTYWSQFSSGLVSTLHRGGLRVCAWQYVYGSHPKLEAEVAARAVRAGADCLLIDAEGEYQGRYAAAQTYLRDLRSLVGASYPVGLASFPYVDYHPSFPYSVFLGPGGAQFNVPQMYWSDIGVTVDAVYAHTYVYNSPYQRPIVPVGEVAGNPPPPQIERFRQFRRVYRAPAVSWWDWQSASARSWSAISATIPNLEAVTPQSGMPFLSYRGHNAVHQGDLVVWAQEHLWSAGYRVKIDGGFGSATRTAVQRFQSAHGLPVTGQINTATWEALLRYRPANVTWTSGGAQTARSGARARAGGLARGAGTARAGGTSGLVLGPPSSSRLPARAYEIPADLGAG